MTIKTLRSSVTLVALLLTAGCSSDHFNILNTNAPTDDQLTGAPNKLILGRAVVGVAANFLNDVIAEITQFAYLGREGWNLQGNDPRYTTEMVRGPLDPGGHAGGSWIGKYIALRTVNTYLAGVDQAPDLTPAERSASKGFAKTIKAILLHRAIVRNGVLGIPMDVEAGLDQPPAPFISHPNVYTRLIALLDEARADLTAAGTTPFPFTMPDGYAGFNTPATFMRFNRAYAAKVHAHRATFINGANAAARTTDYNNAIAALNLSFIDANGDLRAGVFYAFNSAAGEPANGIAEPLSSVRYYVHESYRTGAQLKANGQPDDRYTSKTAVVATRTQNSITSTIKPVMYNVPGTLAPDLGADIPVIKNEELILLRAEARWFTGDKAGAIADLDVIRTRSGGLPATTLTAGSTDAAFITELVYNRRYSLLWEQGTRWTDARRFGIKASLPVDRVGDTIFDNMPVPSLECDARGLAIPCTPPVQ
jgi:hypothetical protein